MNDRTAKTGCGWLSNLAVALIACLEETRNFLRDAVSCGFNKAGPTSLAAREPLCKTKIPVWGAREVPQTAQYPQKFFAEKVMLFVSFRRSYKLLSQLSEENVLSCVSDSGQTIWTVRFLAVIHLKVSRGCRDEPRSLREFSTALF